MRNLRIRILIAAYVLYTVAIIAVLASKIQPLLPKYNYEIYSPTGELKNTTTVRSSTKPKTVKTDEGVKVEADQGSFSVPPGWFVILR